MDADRLTNHPRKRGKTASGMPFMGHPSPSGASLCSCAETCADHSSMSRWAPFQQVRPSVGPLHRTAGRMAKAELRRFPGLSGFTAPAPERQAEPMRGAIDRVAPQNPRQPAVRHHLSPDARKQKIRSPLRSHAPASSFMLSTESGPGAPMPSCSARLE